MPLKSKNLKLINSKKVLTSVLLAWALHMGAQPVLVDGIVAVVGKNIVLKSAVDQQYQARQNQQQQLEVDFNQCQVFEELMLEKLLLHQAALDSLEIGEEEVEMNMERRLEVYIQRIGSQQKLEQYYGKTLIEIKEEMRSLVKDQMTAQRMMQEINKDISITPGEVRRFYSKIPEDSLPLLNAEIEYSQIIKFPKVTNEAAQEAIDRLNAIKQRISEGSSFSTMAVLYSEDPGSAKNGGEYKGIKRGQFVKEFEAVAFNLEIGEISNPFKTEYGYHIVQLQLKRGQELDLRHILIKPKIAAAELQKAQKELDSVRNLITNGALTFEAAAEKFSDDEDSRLNGGKVLNPQTGDTHWEISQLDKTVFYALEGLPIDKVSEPTFFRTPDEKEGYRLLKVSSRTDAHVANLTTDYQRIKQAALAEKKQQALQNWVKEKLQSTYVWVNNSYMQCQFDQNWIKKSQTDYVN